MIIAGRYSFNGGEQTVAKKYPQLLREIEEAIKRISPRQLKPKISRERTMPGKELYSPIELNSAFKNQLLPLGWTNYRVPCDYPTTYYTEEFSPKPLGQGAFREMDFLKEKLGLEVQFGKYAFMVYNVCAKMTIFSKRGIIDAGVEVVPVKLFANNMSSGVSYFEQFVWDLEARGISDIDIPVFIIGVASKPNVEK